MKKVLLIMIMVFAFILVGCNLEDNLEVPQLGLETESVLEENVLIEDIKSERLITHEDIYLTERYINEDLEIDILFSAQFLEDDNGVQSLYVQHTSELPLKNLLYIRYGNRHIHSYTGEFYNGEHKINSTHNDNYEPTIDYGYRFYYSDTELQNGSKIEDLSIYITIQNNGIKTEVKILPIVVTFIKGE